LAAFGPPFLWTRRLKYIMGWAKVNSFSTYMLMLLAVLIAAGFTYNKNVAQHRLQLARLEGGNFHSLANYHGYLTAWMVGLGGLIVFTGGLYLKSLLGSSQSGNLLWMGLLVLASLAVIFLCNRFIHADFRARNHVETLIKGFLICLSILAVLTTLGIILSLLFESLRFFDQVPMLDFLFGLQWSPQTALRADQAGQSGAFGAVPIFAGTFLIMLIAMLVAGPVGLMIAVYLSEYASKRTRAIVKPTIEILAGIPTVVYGFFALLTVGPTIRTFAESLGFSVPTQSALAAGVVMGVMIIPLISSLSDDVINAVPQSLRDGSYALGATRSETMTKIIFAGALPGIIGAFLLAISRAIGETMIVVMAAGRAANLTGNPFESVTTVTVQIVALLTGDQEFDSPKTLAAFALGLVLFVITLILNVIALTVVRRYRERYE